MIWLVKICFKPIESSQLPKDVTVVGVLRVCKNRTAPYLARKPIEFLDETQHTAVARGHYRLGLTGAPRNTHNHISELLYTAKVTVGRICCQRK